MGDVGSLPVRQIAVRRFENYRKRDGYGQTAVGLFVPLTTRGIKELLRRLFLNNLPSDDDVIEDVYGREDFKRGVEAFLART